jgi:hypothetical protein
MAGQLIRVNAGDLIRAEDYNLLLARLEDLDGRLQKLELGTGGPGQTGAPVIDAINPPSPRVGDTVIITGRAFDYAIGAASASVDGLSVTLLAGSSDVVLIFQMPSVVVPQGGRPVQFTVSNLRLSTTRSLLVLPDLPLLQGGVNIQFEDTQPARITANQQCTFHYKLVSDANLPVALTLSPTISVPAWQAGLQILDETGAAAANRTVTVGSLLTKDFFVRVAQITPVVTGFTMNVIGQGEGVVASSGAQAFTVGQVGAQDPEIRLSIEGVIRGGPGGDPLSGTTVTLKTGEQAELSLLAKFHQPVTYPWKATVGSGWTVTDTSSLPPNQFTIQQSDIKTSGPDAGWAVKSAPVVVKAPAATGATDFTFTLQRQGATLQRSLTLRLIAEA